MTPQYPYPRSHPRTDVCWTAKWEDPRGLLTEGDVLDISLRGAFLRPGQRWLGTPTVGPGSRLVLHLTTTDGKSFDLSGVIRWSGRSHAHSCFGFGVEFDEPPEPVTQYLSRVTLPADATPTAP